MSDVSGIPNMGFGGGNFFAPSFSYNPQMSAGQASAAYMPAENYAQNVTNNIFSSGGGFGRQTDYYSQLGANYLAQVPSSWENPYAGGGVPASLAYPGASLSGGYTTGTANMPSFDTGPNFGFTSGGAGAIDLSRAGNLFSGGLGSGGSAPAIDWSGVGQAAASLGGANPYPNMSMPGGLGTSASSPSGASPFNWSDLWGGGGARAEPSLGTTAPAPTPSYGSLGGDAFGSSRAPNVGAAAGSNAPYTSGIAPDQTGGQTFTGTAAPADPFPGMAMPGGLGSPMTTPEPGANFGERFDALGSQSAPEGTRSYNFAPMFEGGGGGGFGTGGTESQLFGAPAAGAFGSNPFSYTQDPSETTRGPEAGGPSADKLAEDARQRLSDIINGAPTKEAEETAKAVEATAANASSAPDMRDFPSPANEYDKFQQPATPLTGYDADVDFLAKHGAHNTKMRPGGAGLGGIDENIHLSAEGPYKSLQPELAARLRAVGEAYEKATGRRANYGETSRGSDVQQVYWDRYQSGEGGLAARPESSRHRQGNAMDIPRGDFRDWADKNGAQFGIVFPYANDKVHVQLSPDYQGPNFVRPPAEIPYPQGVPLPAERPAGAPASVGERQIYQDPTAPRPPGDLPNLEPFGPPAPAIPISNGGFNAIDAAAKHSGLELARANIDTPIEQIAMERGGQKAVDQVNSMAMGKTPRELMNSYGGLFMSRAEPLFSSLGITRQDFEKALTMPQTRQDLKMRFGEGGWGGGLGPYPEYTGPEEAPGSQRFNTEANIWEKAPNTWADFRQSDNIDDRRAEATQGLASRLWDQAKQTLWEDKQGVQDWFAKPADPTAFGLPPIKNEGASDISTPYPFGTPLRDQLAQLQASGVEITPDDYNLPSEAPSPGTGYDDIFAANDAAASEPTSMRDFPSPANDYSTFQAGVRDLSNPVDAAIAESAPPTGLDFAHWKAIAEIESDLNPASNKTKPTQYKGLYQIGSKATDPEWATHGMGDIYNPMDNALAASRLFQYNAERFKAVYGRDPTPGEAYVLHNQGLGFFTRNLDPVGDNVPAGHGFTVPATHDTFVTDWNRYLEEKAARYR